MNAYLTSSKSNMCRGSCALAVTATCDILLLGVCHTLNMRLREKCIPRVHYERTRLTCKTLPIGVPAVSLT